MPRVLVTPHLLHDIQGPYFEALTKAGLEVVYPTGNRSLMSVPALVEDLAGVEAILAGMEPLNREVLLGSKLRVVARMGVGYDAVDVPTATERGIPVCITPGTNEPSVAEQTLALILGVYRGFPARDREARSGAWQRVPLPRLTGKTLGVVGLGRIGRALVPRAHGLGMKVIACDPFCDAAAVAALKVPLVSFEELLATADIVSLHCPRNALTENLIDAKALARMKAGSVLINTSRGEVVDEPALVEALKSGHLFGAGLDVFRVEPLPADHPLTKLDNVLLSPHMGGLDHESVIAMSHLAAECIANLYQGRWPEGCVVNEQLRSAWKW